VTQTPCRPQTHGRRLPWPGILALALTGVPATARDLDSDLPARLREPMHRFVDRGEVSGSAVLVGGADRVVGSEIHGELKRVAFPESAE
jgi:hypothetical protein